MKMTEQKEIGGKMAIKLMGSRKVLIQCRKCEARSDEFIVTLTENSEGGQEWLDRMNIPDGWGIDDKAELLGGTIYGFCPKHCGQ